MTPILKVITEYCAIYVNDINLQELASEDMPLYARQMWGYLRPAISLFTHPPDMNSYLVGTPQRSMLIEPSYDACIYTVSEDIITTTVVDLGDRYSGFELYCARIRTTDAFGNIYYSPAPNVNYDSKAGQIILSASATAPIQKDTVYEIDFYTDGYFLNTLTSEMMNILGYCFQVVWWTRFNNDYLSNVSKIEDRSFTEQNRANKMNADTARLRDVRRQLAEEMRRCEQRFAYRKVFPLSSPIPLGGNSTADDFTHSDIDSTYLIANQNGKTTQIPLPQFLEATKEIDITEQVNTEAPVGLIQVVIDATNNNN